MKVASMKEKIRVYEMGRGQADDVRVADKRLVLVVIFIEERTPLVMFLVNPNITDFRQKKDGQGMSFQAIGETRFVKMAPTGDPVQVTIDGTVYTIAVDSIGTTQEAKRRAYCDFVVSWSE
jgi:hypothetical protein